MRKLLLLVLIASASCGCQRASNRVVVYSAQDEEYVSPIMLSLNKQGSQSVFKFDTEANKSVSLVVELQQEAQRPRCDVHWNNEILGTIRLARQGLYQPYQSPNAQGHPAWSRAKDGTWQAFAQRSRVLLVNTDLVPKESWPKSILDLTDPKWKGKVAMAKPQFGTTATQAACLFEVLGTNTAKEFYRGLKANDVLIVAGNKQAATGVSEGRAAIGMTDSDDAIVELLAGKPVAIIHPDETGHPLHTRLGTLYIPNTLAIVANCPNPDGAKKLIDTLLLPEIEETLANGGGYQFPVNPTLTTTPHPSLKTPLQVKAMAVDFEKAADLWDETQKFLRDEFAR